MDGLLYEIAGLVGFDLYMSQMSHQTMFLTIRLRTMRVRNQTKFQYISVPYGQVLATFRVPLQLL